MAGASCAAGTGTSNNGGSSGVGVTANGTTGTNTGPTGPSGTTGNTMSTASQFMTNGATTGSGMMGPQLFYMHTGKELYSLPADTPSMKPTDLGSLTGCLSQGGESSMTDIGVSATGDIWMVGASLSQGTSHLYHVVPQNGQITCSFVASATVPTGALVALTFAPVGVLDPNKEVLVGGDTGGNMYSLIPNGSSVATKNLGSLGGNWELSGDIVFAGNNGSPVGFATIRSCPNPPSTTGCDTSDSLALIDMTALAAGAGQPNLLKKVQGQTVGFGKMYGVSAYKDKVFGFSTSGDIVQINNTNGSATLVQKVSCGTNPCAWDGAGVTTAVQITPPPM